MELTDFGSKLQQAECLNKLKVGSNLLVVNPSTRIITRVARCLCTGTGRADGLQVCVPPDPAGLFSEGGEVIKLHI